MNAAAGTKALGEVDGRLPLHGLVTALRLGTFLLAQRRRDKVGVTIWIPADV